MDNLPFSGIGLLDILCLSRSPEVNSRLLPAELRIGLSAFRVLVRQLDLCSPDLTYSLLLVLRM